MKLFASTITVNAHCDLPCGIYDPAQARIEALSVKACMEKYHASDDADFKAPHFEKYPNLNELFNEATKLAGAGGTKGTNDVAVADKLIAKIDEIAAIFADSKK